MLERRYGRTRGGLRLTVACLAIAGLVGAACGSDDGDSSSTDTAATDTGSTDTAATDTGSTETAATDTSSTDTAAPDTSSSDTAAPAASFDTTAVVRVGEPIDLNGGPTFDPGAFSLNPLNGQWMNLIYDTMIHVDADGKGVPGLATEWTAVDPTTFELKLRPDVTFTDGTPFNADAVKKAWDRLVAAAQPGMPSELKAITAVTVVDDTTVQVTLSSPVIQKFFDDTLRTSFWLAVPSPTATDAGTLNAAPVGAGPQAFESYEAGQKIVLARNPDYWDADYNGPGGFEFQNLAYGEPAINALKAGTVDLTWQVSLDAIAPTEDAGFTVDQLISPAVTDIVFCTAQGPFADKTARQAIQYAIDRDAVNAAALNGLGRPWQTLLTDSSPFFDESLNDVFEYDTAKAMDLLEQGGAAGAKVRMLVQSRPPFPAIGDVVQAMLTDVGLDVEVIPTDNAQADAGTVLPDIQLTAVDPSLVSQALLNPTGGNAQQPCGYTNPDIQAAYSTALDASQPESARQAAWTEIQEIIHEESPLVFMTNAPVVVASTENIDGVVLDRPLFGPLMQNIVVTQ